MQIMFIGIRSYMFQIMTRVTILMNLICPFTNPENKTKLLQNAAAGGPAAGSSNVKMKV